MTTSDISATKALASQLVATLTDDSSPFCSGTLKLPPRALTLYYGKQGGSLGRVDFAKNGGDADALDKLEKACDPATFGRNKEDVLDDSYRKAGKLDSENFALGFDAIGAGLVDAVRVGLLRCDEKRPVIAELYKLNVYGKGAFFKAHQDTPRAANMFGSLVVSLPSPHEGGALLLRQKDREWTFDSAKIFADLGAEVSSHIAFVAFYSDVEHEVLPVTSGHRVTITYNLYYGDKADTHAPVPGLRILEPVSVNEANIEGALKALLADPHMLADGGLLGFGLRYEYPLDPKEDGCLEHVQRWLKGGDAALFAACKDLGLRPLIRFVPEDDWSGAYAMFDRPLDVGEWDTTIESTNVVFDLMRKSGNSVPLQHAWARLEHAYDPDAFAAEIARQKEESYYAYAWEERAGAKTVFWVTERKSGTTYATPYVTYGNESVLGNIYSPVCLVAEVRSFAERAATGAAAVDVATE